MNVNKRKGFVAVVGLLSLVGIGTAVAIYYALESGATKYLDAPFEKVGSDFPRIIPVQEWPPAKDKAAVEKYRKERNAVRAFLVEGGAVQRATPEEREVIKALYDDKTVKQKQYIRVREMAEKVLQDNDRSIPALYALAQAQFEGEGNLPLALFAIRKARHLLEKAGQQDPRDADSREWYLRCLDVEYRILTHLDRNEEQIRVVELMEQVYEPLPWMKVWPSFKLKRLDDAERFISETEQTGHWKEKSLNDRLALAEQRHQRSEQYEAALALTKEVTDTDVYLSNAAGAALCDFRIPEAEKFLLQAVACKYNSYFGTPYRGLTSLYLQQGRLPDAVAAYKKGRQQRAKRDQHTHQQDQARMERTLALMLLAAGEQRGAERVARRAYQMQDRLGYTTEKKEDQELTNGLILWTTLEARMEELRERDATTTLTARLTPSTGRKAVEFEIWTLRQRLLKILSEATRINDLRPYMPGSAEVETWMLGSIIELLPPGVAVEAIRKTRAEEAPAIEKARAENRLCAAPYLDALEAEAALRRASYDEAWTLAQQALSQLPDPGERLLRGRTAAVAAEAAHQLRQEEESRKLMDQVLRDFPQAIRLLKFAIPVHVEDDGSPLAHGVAEYLLKSPRFRSDGDGFSIVIRSLDGQLNMEMFRLGRVQHFSIQVPVTDSEGEVAPAALAKFHEKLMSPTLDLNQLGIGSLDGSLSAVKAQGEIDGLMNLVKPK